MAEQQIFNDLLKFFQQSRPEWEASMHYLLKYLGRRSGRKTQVSQMTREEIIGHLDNFAPGIAPVRPLSVSKDSEGVRKEELFIFQLEKIKNTSRRAPVQEKHTIKSIIGVPILKSSESI
ncbi:hypothetical protein ACRAWG_27670 [Methylobacterium sp. P31]